MRPPNIYLIGPMGSGKTAVGRALARRLGWAFVDTDERVARSAKRSVAEIFRLSGERAFRRLEGGAVRLASARGRQVVALGGGAALIPGVLPRLQETGIIVRLLCDQRVLWRRLKATVGSRPLLRAATAAQSRRKLAAVLRARAHYPAGDLRVSTSRLPAGGAAAAIMRLLASAWRLG